MPDAPLPSPLRTALDRFDARLRASGSATRTLEAWMAEHHGSGGVQLGAHVRALVASKADAAIMRRLGVEDWRAVRYRRVWLASGGRVLSVAENWYVPARLDSGMASQLADGRTPFGAVIAPLEPRRETLGAVRLWDGVGGPPPAALLRHHALVHAGDGAPLCEVSEVYTRNILV
ncbi:MAG: hypothetical protein LKF30_10280 [Sphingobium sp.]|jgi:chorismate-pyruvate lyase|nr:hypothetical protein [Sphingobium sp.]MCI1270940.1 hypothetical protein [Sphingobium sp.]MCI1757303.1 hypothetical protein [Sphingobium sp.]MCI2053525.1 hypothetical protein [Sphingobium sp.]